ncbi:MAG: hypothetical protein LBD89_01195 [Tannerellaceae bacterium]|jgi:hypothetical protein|nr:hypothetical protein [Tannerellaceae bacterium]
MKIIRFFIFPVLALGAVTCTQTGQKEASKPPQSHKRVIHVQGHPHELLTQLHGAKDVKIESGLTSTPTDSIVIDSFMCWVGGLDPTIPSEYVDSAVLLVKWTDGKRQIFGDSILAWGYRWNTISIYNDPVFGPETTFIKKYTIDMIRAVANSDCAFSALLQNTSEGNFAVGGFGFNHGGSQRVEIDFDTAGAAADTANIKFHYTGSPNCDRGQGAIPYNVEVQAYDAILRSTGPLGTGTGIIRHPFDADYGYPAYDYDYWALLNPSSRTYRWQAGWYDGYWSFFNKEGLNGPFTYSNYSITTRQLGHYSVDGFAFNTDVLAWPPVHDMSGNYTTYGCICGCSN